MATDEHQQQTITSYDVYLDAQIKGNESGTRRIPAARYRDLPLSAARRQAADILAHFVVTQGGAKLVGDFIVSAEATLYPNLPGARGANPTERFSWRRLGANDPDGSQGNSGIPVRDV